MIERLRGRVVERTEDSVVLDARGVGFRVRISAAAANRLRPREDETTLVIRLLPHRDEALVLHGFASTEEAGVFDRLRGVSGVGPGVAMKLLSLTVPRIRQAIEDKDIGPLVAAPGVGKKLARRIITDLAGALPVEETAAPAGPSGRRDPLTEQLVSALQHLQFRDLRRVREVAREVRRDQPEAGFEEAFKAALTRIAPRGTR